MLLIAVTVVLITVIIQIYWNINNYDTNKQRIILAAQSALDSSIDNYYNDKAKSNIIYSTTGKDVALPMPIHSKLQRDAKNIKFYHTEIHTDSTTPKRKKATTIFISNEAGLPKPDNIKDVRVLAEKIVISVRQDSVDLKKIAQYIDKEFARKNLDFDYALLYKVHFNTVSQYHNPEDKKYLFSTRSKSSFLPQNSNIELFFPDIFYPALQEGMLGIILSLVLSLSIVFCLFYLLHIIRKQKQLAIIKNDFISNVSHELKTPIAVVNSALEGIEKFNSDNEPEKTKKYLEISNQHLSKLNLIVEKILETSILESDQLRLQKEPVALIGLINTAIDKFRINTDKAIVFHSPDTPVIIFADTFHFENVISNLIDNALKYGGDCITVTLQKTDAGVAIAVSDNGKGIDKIHRQKIFEKFYRVPKNNQHDEKGFGIGLYYCKNIVEKHGGKIDLIAETQTTFKIFIPHE